MVKEFLPCCLKFTTIGNKQNVLFSKGVFCFVIGDKLFIAFFILRINMKELEERIKKDGIVLPGDILKVGSFLNHNIDIKLLESMGRVVAEHFPTATKVLTIEASGIAFATIVAHYLGCDLVFAKKSKTSNLSGDIVTSRVSSYTHNTSYDIYINKGYIKDTDNVLIVDDFLALGNALHGLIDLCNQLGAKVVGCSVQIEKEYQGGGNMIRKMGYEVLSLAKIKEIKGDEVIF